ncbi:hypothetical protein ACFMI3_19215, partial [Acinetobacter baumannii]
MTAIQGVIMSNSLSKTTAYVQVIQNDQQAINAAYQVADFALEGRNTRDQQRLLPQEQIESFSQKGLGGIRIAKKYGKLEPKFYWKQKHRRIFLQC